MFIKSKVSDEIFSVLARSFEFRFFGETTGTRKKEEERLLGQKSKLFRLKKKRLKLFEGIKS